MHTLINVYSTVTLMPDKKDTTHYEVCVEYCEYLRSLGYDCYIINASPTPDIVAIGNGEVLLVEVKVVKSVKNVVHVPTKQLEFLRRLRDSLRKVTNCRAVIVFYVVDDCEFHEINVDYFEEGEPLDLLV